MSAKIRRRLFYIFYLAITIWNIYFWYSSYQSTILMTISLYLTLGILAFYWVRIQYLSRGKIEQAIKYKTLIISTILSLFVGELLIKYVAGFQLNYFERNGSIYYRSPYPKPKITKWERENYLTNYLANDFRIKIKAEFQYKHAYNELGLRDRSIQQLPLSKDTLIIAGLGDSYTEGVGASQDSTWLRAMEKAINEDALLQPVYTINLGHSGSDPFFQFEKLRYKFDDIRPDLVIMTVNFTDLNDVFIRGGKERFDRDNPYVRPGIRPWWEPFYAGSMYVRVISTVFFEYNDLMISKRKMKENKLESCHLIADLIKDLVDFGQQEGFKVVTVLHPLSDELIYDHFLLNELEMELKDDPDVKVINLYTHFIGNGMLTKENYTKFYWPIDKHHNPKGYQLLGNQLKLLLEDFEYLKH